MQTGQNQMHSSRKLKCVEQKKKTKAKKPTENESKTHLQDVNLCPSSYFK